MPLFIELIDAQDNELVVIKTADISSMKSLKSGSLTEIKCFVGATIISSTPYVQACRLFDVNAIKRVPPDRSKPLIAS